MSLYDGWTQEEVAKHEQVLLRQQRGFPPDPTPSTNGRFVRWRVTLSCGHQVTTVRSDWQSQPERASCREHGRRTVSHAKETT